ncbi:MAG: FtsX-like permease family protein [Candidatus Moranbacteria bacterium]|nr:FtsX-like permease family protein [Candidatus Moranbacteria bacterium]NTW45909.1 FtsX-like permease family protein [Candidatus Moranbacteria bacterium]
MLFIDLIQETYIALTTNKVRSGLTMLGIVIGIASVIAMIAVGQGAQKSVEDRIQSIGSNLLMIRPGAARSPGQTVSQGQGSSTSLSLEDADAIGREIDGLSAVAPSVSGNYQVVADGSNTRTSVTGTLPAYAAVRNVSMDSGSFFTEAHDARRAKVAVIGPDVRDELFPDETDLTGKKIRINGIDFTVLGLTATKGGSGMDSSDDVVYVPLSTAMQYLTGSDSLSMISVTVSDQALMDQASADISSLLFERHGLSDSDTADFRVMNQSDIVETASSVTETFTLLLGAVAGISLVVGGIGIMNMMLTTVTERTREIGLRKAIGAKGRDIRKQFLVESVALTFLGGVVGIGVGWLTATLLTKFASVSTSVSTSSVVLSFGVSAGIGILFGYYPARRAARLNPIEALRYE